MGVRIKDESERGGRARRRRSVQVRRSEQVRTSMQGGVVRSERIKREERRSKHGGVSTEG